MRHYYTDRKLVNRISLTYYCFLVFWFAGVYALRLKLVFIAGVQEFILMSAILEMFCRPLFLSVNWFLEQVIKVDWLFDVLTLCAESWVEYSSNVFVVVNAPLRQNPPIYPCVKEVRIRSYSGPHFSRIFPHFPDSFNAVTLCFGIFIFRFLDWNVQSVWHSFSIF